MSAILIDRLKNYHSIGPGTLNRDRAMSDKGSGLYPSPVVGTPSIASTFCAAPQSRASTSGERFDGNHVVLNLKKINSFVIIYLEHNVLLSYYSAYCIFARL